MDEDRQKLVLHRLTFALQLTKNCLVFVNCLHEVLFVTEYRLVSVLWLNLVELVAMNIIIYMAKDSFLYNCHKETGQ